MKVEFSHGPRSTRLLHRQIEEKKGEIDCVDREQLQQTSLFATARIIHKVINTQILIST